MELTREQVEDFCKFLGLENLSQAGGKILAHDAALRQRCLELEKELEHQIDTGIKVNQQRDEMEAKREKEYDQTAAALIQRDTKITALEMALAEARIVVNRYRTNMTKENYWLDPVITTLEQALEKIG